PPLHRPPQPERGDAGVLLFHHYLALAARRFGRTPPDLHPADINAILSHDGPGNVRELKAAADRFVLGLSANGRALGDMLGQRAPEPNGVSLADRVAAYERHVIEAELRRHDDSVAAVAAALQGPRRSLDERTNGPA